MNTERGNPRGDRVTTRGRTNPELAPALKRLVKVVEATLGSVVVEAEGKRLFDAVEAIRLEMVEVREGDRAALRRARRRLRRLSPAERTSVARAYTVYLELVNVCENAYRTHRLRERARATEPHAEPKAEPAASANVVFVLTAHPTESRSPTNIRLMRRIQTLLLEGLERRDPPDAGRLVHLCCISCGPLEHTPPTSRPSRTKRSTSSASSTTRF